MTRLPFALTLSLLASTAFAGPPVEQPAPAPAPAPVGAGSGATVYDCQIAGRNERFVIAGGAGVLVLETYVVCLSLLARHKEHKYDTITN